MAEKFSAIFHLRTKKAPPTAGLFIFLALRLFARVNSTGGASVGASAAVEAFFGIDFVDIAFRNSAGRTFAHTRSASNTIVTDYVSHDFEFLISTNIECVRQK